MMIMAGERSDVEQRREHRLDRLAEWIESRGLRAPAVLFLEAFKPLAPVGSQLLLLVQPLFGAARSPEDRTLDEVAAMIEDPEAIERFIARLEGTASSHVR